MKLRAGAEDDESAKKKKEEEYHLPPEVDWEMLDKSKFFILGAVMFSGVSGWLYPVVVLKTRQQVALSPQRLSCFKTAVSIVRNEGLRGLYRGFGTSLLGTIPARVLYMAALEATKSNVGNATTRLGFSEYSSAAIGSAVGGMTSSMAAQVVWTPVDVVTQRLMVQGGGVVADPSNAKLYPKRVGCRYVNGYYAFRKILRADGPRGLYRGFGVSVLTYAPTNAVWWASYSVVQKMLWSGIGRCRSKMDENEGVNVYTPGSKTVMAVQGASAGMAASASALITMPLDTVKTRLQVLDGDDNGRRGPTFVQTARNLIKEGGWMACYRGLGPRCTSMSLSATTMITTYEFIKRMALKNLDEL